MVKREKRDSDAKREKRTSSASYVAVVGIDYPSPESLEMVLKAGGRSKLTPEQRERLAIVNVAPGEECVGIPVVSVEKELRKGRIKVRRVKDGDAR